MSDCYVLSMMQSQRDNALNDNVALRAQIEKMRQDHERFSVSCRGRNLITCGAGAHFILAGNRVLDFVKVTRIDVTHTGSEVYLNIVGRTK